MHTLLVLASLLIAGFAGVLCIRLLGLVRSWGSRRSVQITGMLIPVIVLSILALTVVHFISQVCWWGAPPMDVAITQAFSLVGAVAVVLAFLLNAMRAALLPLHLRRRTWEAPKWLQDRVAEVAASVGMTKPPRVRVAADSRPWALVAGPLRPHLVVSSGLIVLLDAEELSAVLCHELLHIRRSDLWWSAVASALYDLTWFLPATRLLYRKMMAEQEIACDDHIVGETRRLALASALARVWQAQVRSAPSPRGSLGLISPEQTGVLEGRMRRLLDLPGIGVASSHHRALSISLVLLCLFIVAQLGATAVAMNNMGCGLYQFWAVTAPMR